MRPLLLFTLLAICAGCTSEAPPAPPVSDVLSADGTPPVYATYEAVAPLFAQTNDTTYLINFWATWCKPCLEELPLLQELSDGRTADEALRVILVSLDTEPGAIARIPEYLSGRGIKLPTVVLTDESPGWMRDLDEKWDGSLPTTFVYRGPLRYIYRRPWRTLPDVRAAVAPLLGQ
ncbi:redoxin domain-containing protein [Lewinella sp. IMCC34183]|uniref:redoxin domain-containing protein n=1 Tax=Lewinella sp. IMCC34183 TaxID=2248762 RepID=UPI000E280EE5|nr:redoxin domain-containing protein [Lewinella sp. IMCC34183]